MCDGIDVSMEASYIRDVINEETMLIKASVQDKSPALEQKESISFILVRKAEEGQNAIAGGEASPCRGDLRRRSIHNMFLYIIESNTINCSWGF